MLRLPRSHKREMLQERPFLDQAYTSMHRQNPPQRLGPHSTTSHLREDKTYMSARPQKHPILQLLLVGPYDPLQDASNLPSNRSEERRVGKECKTRWWKHP